MAGQDQSANLGGMLTEIAKTTGSMADAYKPVMQAATKPRGDMNDPAHLQRLAQWASSNGDSAAASMYMQQARAASAEAKEKAKEAQDLQRTQSANAVTAQYKKALESGDPDLIAKAQEAVMAGANANGYNAQDRMNAASKAVKAQQDEAFKVAEQERVNKERAATEAFAQKINATEDIDAVLAAVADAPPELAEQAQRMANTRANFLNNVADRKAAREADQAAVSTEFAVPEGLPENIAKPLQTEHARIEKLAKESKNADGTWKEQGRQAVDKAMNKLLDDAQRAAISLAVAEESDKRQRLRTIDHRRQQIAVDNPTKDEYARIEEMLNAEYAEQGLTQPGEWWGTNPKKASGSEVVDRFRQEQRDALDLEVQSITGEKPAEPTDKAPAGGVVEVASVSEAEALPKGTKFKLPDGRTGTVE